MPDELSDGDVELLRKAHWAIDKVTNDMAGRFAFNTAIAAIMELTNTISKQREEGDPSPGALRFALATAASLLFPFAPHTAADAYERLTGRRVWEEPWPAADQRFIERDTYELVCQVNGKVRDRVQAPTGAAREELEALCLATPKVRAHIDGKDVVKVVVVPERWSTSSCGSRSPARSAWRGRGNHADGGRSDGSMRELAQALRRFVASGVSAVTRGRLASRHARRQPPTARRLRPRGARVVVLGVRFMQGQARGSAVSGGRPRGSAAAGAPTSGGSPRAAAGRGRARPRGRGGAQPGRVPAARGRADAGRRPPGGRSARGADLNAINLAAKVADGQQVVVPAAGSGRDVRAGDRRGREPGGPPPAPVSLNTRDGRAAGHARRRRPGDGGKILDWRRQHGGFRSIDDLGEIPGIGPKRLAALRGKVQL